MSVYLLCEQAIGLVRGNRLVLSDTQEVNNLENLNYQGLVSSHAQDEAVVCALHFARVRDKLLSLYPWVFARKSASLNGSTENNVGWSYSSALPSDCLAVLAVTDNLNNGELIDYEVINGSVYTNSRAITLRYTAQITDTTVFPSVFCEALTSYLAAEIAPSVVGETSAAEFAIKKGQLAISEARQLGLIRAEVNLTPKDELIARAVSLVHGQRSLKTTSEKAVTEGIDNTGDINARRIEEQKVGRQSFTDIRDRLLSLYSWNFARKKAIITNGEYPSDFLTLLAVFVDGVPVDIETLETGTQYEIRYTAKITDSSKWDAVFKDVFCYSLAIEIAAATTPDANLIQLLEQKCQELIQKAQQIGLIKPETRIHLQQEIYNRAIALARGQRIIGSTSNVASNQGQDNLGTPNFRVEAEINACKRASESIRDRLLNSHAWLFARKNTALVATVTTISGWSYGYKIPDDCISILAVLHNGEPIEFEVSGEGIYVNVQNISIRYISRITDMSKWTGTFIDVFVNALAQEIILSTTANLEAVQLLEQKQQILLRDAYKSGQIKPETKVLLSEELYNRAISLLHGQDVISLTSGKAHDEGLVNLGDMNLHNREEIVACKRSSNYVRDRLLSLHAWLFARKTAVLSIDRTSTGWTNAYSLPSDCVNVLSVIVNGEPVDFEIADNKILCNGANAYARYTARITDMNSWSPSFKDAFCYALAVEISASVIGNQQVTAMLEQKSENIIRQAYQNGSIRAEVKIPVQDEICSRAIALAQGTRTISPVSEQAVTQGVDNTGHLNDRYLECVSVAKRSYEPVRDRVLQMYPWVFARKTSAVLSGDNLPSDCLAVLAVLVNNEPCDWEITSGKLITQSSFAVDIHYTAKITDSSKWDAIFKDVFCYSLAVEIVSATTANNQTIQVLEQKINEIIRNGYQLGVIKAETFITAKSEIFKRAIGLIHGQRTITPTSEAAYENGIDTLGKPNIRAEEENNACLRAYESVRDKLLQLHPWVFARKSKNLESRTSTTRGWKYGFDLPNDCLTVLAVLVEKNYEAENSSLQGVYVEPVEWEVAGEVLYCDYLSVTLRYTARITEMSKYPPSFVDAYVYMLALEVMSATAPANQGTAEAAKLFIEGINTAITQAYKMKVICSETKIPIRQELCNRAIGLIAGLKDIDPDVLNNNEELQVCLRNFDYVRDRLLQLYPWVFARKVVKPQRIIEDLSGWRYAFNLPSDCLKVVSVVADDKRAEYEMNMKCLNVSEFPDVVELIEYEATGEQIYTNRNPIYLRYTARVTDTKKWAPAFTDVFCIQLAIEIAMSISKDKNIIQIFEKQTEQIIQSAIENGVIKAETGLLKQNESRRNFGRTIEWLDYSGIPTQRCSPLEICKGGYSGENITTEFCERRNNASFTCES